MEFFSLSECNAQKIICDALTLSVKTILIGNGGTPDMVSSFNNSNYLSFVQQ